MIDLNFNLETNEHDGNTDFYLNSSIGLLDIVSDFLPKIEIEGYDNEIQLTQCAGFVTFDSLQYPDLHYLTISPMDIDPYHGRTYPAAVVTLNINGENVTWTGNVAAGFTIN